MTAGPLPSFLLPLRASFAKWASVEANAFAMALINEYRPGSPIGWYRDAPQYNIVAGISLLSPCRMKFRPYRSSAATELQSVVARRHTKSYWRGVRVSHDARVAYSIRTSHPTRRRIA